MKRSLLVTLICLSILSEAQISLSYLDHWQLTPNGTSDSAGVFCRTFYHSGRNKFYTVYSGRPGTSGNMGYFRWQERDASFNVTGNEGVLSGHAHGGDFAIQQVGTDYYHITGTSPYGMKLSKYDRDFNLVNSFTFALDSADSQADMMLNYTNGKLVVGVFHQAGVLHPIMPMQTNSWTPKMHKWEFDLNLVAQGPPVYLNETFDAWGSSVIYNNNAYNIITLNKWPIYHLNVYRYDSSWNFIDSLNLNNDGQWSQGVLWDGNYYYVSYHSGHEHRAGNITVAVYDVNWSLVYDTTITNNPIFDPANFSPPKDSLRYNANRPFLTRVGDTLYVSYDVDDYKLTNYGGPGFAEGQRWQAHVTKLLINNSVMGLNKLPEGSQFAIYPNPTEDFINIIGTEDAIVNVFDLTGNLVCVSRVEKNKILKAGNFPHGGVYIVRMITVDNCVNRRIVIE